MDKYITCPDCGTKRNIKIAIECPICKNNLTKTERLYKRFGKDEVEEIKKKYLDGVGVHNLAKEYGRSVASIYHLTRGLAHVRSINKYYEIRR